MQTGWIGFHDGIEEVIPLSNTVTLSSYKLVLLILIRKYLEGEITGVKFSLFLIGEVKVTMNLFGVHALMCCAEIGQGVEPAMQHAASYL